MRTSRDPVQVLLVEDSPSDALLVSHSLEDAATMSFELTLTKRLEEAVRLVRQRTFDVALLDLALPDSSGLETFNELNREAPALPTIVLTGLADDELATRAVQAGAQDYLPKAEATPRTLERAIRYALARHAAEQALRESESRFRRLSQSNIIGILTADLSGRILDANDGFLELVGYSREDLQEGKLWWTEMTPPEYHSIDQQAVQQLKTEGAVTPFEKEFVHKGGSRVPVLVGAARIEDSGRQTVAFVLDITERKKIEAALRDADHRKDEFLAMLGHELRNPLAAISSAVSAFEEPGIDRSVLHWVHEVIQRQTGHLTRMVNDILDVSRIVHGRIELRRELLDLSTLLSRAIETVRPLFEKKGHRFVWLANVQASAPLLADATRLEQVFVNLLQNSAKYTDPGGTITLSTERDAGTAVVRLRDTGIGMEPGLIDHIFEVFTQAERPFNRPEGGLGLGLALVRRLVELHGGTVTASSEGPGLGSEFIVRLPLFTDPAETAGDGRRAPDVPRGGSGRRILIVDDNLDSLRGLALLLAHRGFEVQTAMDGPSAIEVARRFRPDTLLLDIGLPGMDGYELASHIRAEGLGNARFIAISGYTQGAGQQRAGGASFQHHFVKPVDFAALLDVLKAV